MSKIANCNCESEFQDKQYGKQRRVFNEATKKGAEKEKCRCTVCNREIKIALN